MQASQPWALGVPRDFIRHWLHESWRLLVCVGLYDEPRSGPRFPFLFEKVSTDKGRRRTEGGINPQRPHGSEKEGATMDLITQLMQRGNYLTTKEVMTLLGKRRNTICEWVRTGRMSAIRSGNEYLFDPHVLVDWLSERTTSKPPARRSA